MSNLPDAMPDAARIMENLPVVLAFAVTCLTQRFLLSSKFAERTLDTPNHRSLHENPTPRTGGLALMSGITVAWLWLAFTMPPPEWLSALMIAMLVLAGVSLMDDLKSLPVWIRLFAHFAVCGGFLAALAGSAALTATGIWVWLLLIPMVWGVNLYNFMDGLDGLAGGMAVFGFGAYAVLAALHGGAGLSLVSACVAAAALGFLPYNFAPAKVFLGDAGSIPLGFLAGALGIAGWRGDVWSWWFPLVVFSPFVVDASVTLGYRIARGARLAEAHREHYYQRLAQSGFGHKKTTLLEYGLMAVAGAVAVLGVLLESQAAALLLGMLLAIEFGCMVSVSRAWRVWRARTQQAVDRH